MGSRCGGDGNVNGGRLRFAGGGRLYRQHVDGRCLRRTAGQRSPPPPMHAAAGLGPPSTWPFGGDSIPVANGAGGYLVPTVAAPHALDPNTLHAYQLSSSGYVCALQSRDPAVYTAANNTFLVADAVLGQWGMDGGVPELQDVAVCNSTCWGNATCVAWDMVKVTRTSGKVVPLCTLYSSAVWSCGGDPNQWAGVKAPLPDAANITQQWVLPLSWVGRTVSTTLITPDGAVPGQPAITIAGRNLTLSLHPGRPVRLTVS